MGIFKFSLTGFPLRRDFYFPWETELSITLQILWHGSGYSERKAKFVSQIPLIAIWRLNLEGHPSPGDTFHLTSCLRLEPLQSRACQFFWVIYITIFCCPIPEEELKLVLHQIIRYDLVGEKMSTEIQIIQIQVDQNPSVILNTELFHLLVNRKKQKCYLLK